MTQVQSRVAQKKISKTMTALRDKFWPESEHLLWNPKKALGYRPIPRTMVYVLNMMDALSKNKPVSSTYLALWCKSFDEMILTIKNEAVFAFESGFTGQRAILTWRERMTILESLGFIKSRTGSTKFNYVLILDPHQRLDSLYQSPEYQQILDPFWAAYYERCLESKAHNHADEAGQGE